LDIKWRFFIFIGIAIMAKKSELRKISHTELQKVLEDHRKWLKFGTREGKRTDLSGADLSFTNLSSAKLVSADLSGADLSFTNLSSAKLVSADLSGANLSSANLISADLSGVNLSGANLISANLGGVSGAILKYVSGAILSNADLLSEQNRTR
jgi:uncharacterized protein YjbI with pentapeptide repeats